jgi:predicted metal-dependent enzyme (double-stranded beta helix superfamily)
MPKESNQRKGTTPKNTAILLSHNQTALFAMQNLVFTPGVDYPPHNSIG